MKKDAKLSRCKNYRYVLSRVWDESLPYVNFIGLNPSIADAHIDDPTLRRCMAFARDWDYGGVYTTNLFAWRATDPAVMKQADDPIGPQNNRWIRKTANDAGIIIAAWGNHGSYRNRAAQVIDFLPNVFCLKVTSKQQPAHPLYMPKTQTPSPYLPDTKN